jgi:predicted SnoaL-like aldol condensation-catalyzing enzyme
MGRTNKEIALEYYAEVINGKKLDRLDDFYSEALIWHSPTLIGSGLKLDNSSGDKLTIVGTVPGSPADGVLLPGDQIIWVSDGKNTWDTYQQLIGSSWGSGYAGSFLTFRVLRGAETHEIQLVRAFVEGMTWSLAEQREGFRYYLTELCPDLKITVEHILAEGDMVSAFITNQGTFTDYNRQSIWNSFDLLRFKDGKIVEFWGVDDGLTLQKQQGYRIEPPVN